MNSGCCAYVQRQPSPQDEELLARKELAWRFGVSTRTVDRWQRQGLLPSRKLLSCVLFPWPAALQAALQQGLLVGSPRHAADTSTGSNRVLRAGIQPKTKTN